MHFGSGNGTQVGNLRRYGILDDADRHRRPEIIRLLRFDDLTDPGPQFRDTSGVVPIESVRDGDVQVLAGRGTRPEPGHAIDLDVLGRHKSVTSVVATTRVRSRCELPSITELLLFGGTPLPDSETLRNLPGLRRVWLTWGVRGRVDFAALPADVEALGVAAHHVGPAASGDRFDVLQRFSRLQHLTVRYCLPRDSVAPFAALTSLVELNCDAPSGWARLRTCTALESVTAIQPRLTSFRPLRSWTRLRRLALVAGAGLKSLDGLEAFANLEALRIVLVRAHDLSPIRYSPRLAEVSINTFGHAVPLEVFESLPRLTSLTIETPGDPSDSIAVESLRPLRSVRTLEALSLRGVTVADRSLAWLAELPKLAHLALSGDFGDQVEALTRARPDMSIRWHPSPQPPPGERVGTVLVRPPVEGGSSSWWIREDLSARFAVPTNGDAERRLRSTLQSDDPALLSRLTFDTEADAVCLYASEADIRAVAATISRMARGG